VVIKCGVNDGVTGIDSHLQQLNYTLTEEINNQFIKLHLNRRDKQPVHQITP
jgi:hypothetical protein